MHFRPNKKRKSQQENIQNSLLRGETITPIEALKKFRTFRLAAIIHNLRKEGMDISTTMVTHDGTEFAEYKLETSLDSLV